jgi:hypothetical protein
MKALLRLVLALALGLAICDFAQSEPALDPANGHYYDFVADALDWNSAAKAAAALTYLGLPGHLATITSSSENAFIVSALPAAVAVSGSGWLGGSQALNSATPSSGWSWITDEPWSFTNWNGGEPNDGGDFNENGQENYVHFYFGDGTWNDNTLDSSAFVHGFVVEYETAAVPESGTVSLMLIGTSVLAFRLRRTNKRLYCPAP